MIIGRRRLGARDRRPRQPDDNPAFICPPTGSPSRTLGKGSLGTGGPANGLSDRSDNAFSDPPLLAKSKLTHQVEPARRP
jgi:hypothetical protein